MRVEHRGGGDRARQAREQRIQCYMCALRDTLPRVLLSGDGSGGGSGGGSGSASGGGSGSDSDGDSGGGSGGSGKRVSGGGGGSTMPDALLRAFLTTRRLKA